MKGIDGGYKLSELLFGSGGNADAIVNVTAVEFSFRPLHLGSSAPLIPTESTSAFNSTNLFLFSCHHIPTNGVAPLSAYKPTHNTQFLQSL